MTNAFHHFMFRYFRLCRVFTCIIFSLLSLLIVAQDQVKISIHNEDIYVFDSARIDAAQIEGNLIIGKDAGVSNLATDTTGNYNIFLGYQSGYHNSTGYSNTFVGSNAGAHQYTGSLNTFLGRNAGAGHMDSLNSTSSGNTLIGAFAGGTIFQGNDNTAVGANALGLNILGAGNVAIGHSAGFQETGSNKLYIENSQSVSPLIYGEFDNDILRINGELQIGTAFRFPISDGTANQILQTDGSGQLFWGAVSPVMALIDGDADTKVELYEGATDGVQFTVDNEIIFGVDARSIQFFNNDGNTFVGEMTGIVNSGPANTFIGKETGKSNSTGSANTFIGNSAGASNTSGIQNTYLGSGAGLFNTTDSGNVFIGYQAGHGSTGSNKLIIDNTSTTAPLIYGEFDTNKLGINGSLGVGHQNPSSQLDVRTNTMNVARFESTENGLVHFYKAGVQSGFLQTFNDHFVLGKSSALPGSLQLFNQGNYLTLESDGDVAIGTSSPISNKLRVESLNTNPVIVSQVNYVGSTDVVAIQGTSTPSAGWGYGGVFTGGYRGVHAIADGAGYSGQATALRAEATGTGVGTRIAVYGSATGGATNLAGYFEQGNVRVDDSLSIGTADIAAGYCLTVDGKIIGEELKIQDSGAWPDYVFADDYYLMPLNEVEAAIKKNHHLPGIPSATEVAENGIMVGDMQKKMMEKIEELTLHVIRQQKEIDALKARIGE